MTTTTDDELLALAEAATQGPWVVEDPLSFELSIVQAGLEAYEWQFIASCTFSDEDEDDPLPREQVERNAAFIAAASPDRVIALLETIKDLRAKLRECSR